MQVRCIKPFGHAKPGDGPVEIPDGAAVDPEYWEAVPGAGEGFLGGLKARPPSALIAAIPSAVAVTPKEL